MQEVRRKINSIGSADGDHNGSSFYATAEDDNGVVIFCAVTSFLVLWFDVDEAVQVVPGEMSQVSVQTHRIVIETLVCFSTQTVRHLNVFTPTNSQQQQQNH